jgi:hypothetical protein
MEEVRLAGVVFADDTGGARSDLHIDVLKRAEIPYDNTANPHSRARSIMARASGLGRPKGSNAVDRCPFE